MLDPKRDLQELLLELAETLRAVADKAESIAMVAGSPQSTDESSHLQLVVDREMLSIRWNDRTCHLGNTIPFRLMARLARRPNQYVSHDQLLYDIWGGPRSRSAIRSAVNDLRSRLIAAGMRDLAQAIDGSSAGRYGLILP